ncbi:ATP phosphoribosyltransferase [Sporosarcina newyorkensis 2681]|uniref:ATP phosphoribosyltransferase n=1 Tax=Sporosarcina newyorkensis 2681 TaxID=1027292 RepID=F9DWH1_9BACL|nr:ATP phosphoribosyltransferase [Sporosarcina newyorkensis]EGQ21792.1 ATP phosphoribosyltransferase [Sporosarcina newyorkensis 2681]
MDYLTVAMAKGRTADRAMDFLKKSDVRFSDFTDESRKLVIYDDKQKIKLIFVKAVDVPVYVENGAADVGIVGKDVMLEDPRDVYELLDLGIGRCKLAVAGFPETPVDEMPFLTVASKYPAVAKEYFDKKGIRTEMIKLNGSIELAPLIGMSDVIVDIVETGTTLKENGLVVLQEIAEVSARLIVNKASYATKTADIQQFVKDMKEGLEVRA